MLSWEKNIKSCVTKLDEVHERYSSESIHCQIAGCVKNTNKFLVSQTQIIPRTVLHIRLSYIYIYIYVYNITYYIHSKLHVILEDLGRGHTTLTPREVM
jgi:hypothetical protein